MTDTPATPPCCPVGARHDAAEVDAMLRAADGGVVYFIQCGADGPIKIGKTNRPIAKRLTALQTGNPMLLRLLATIPGYTNVEQDMHVKFRDLRIRTSEWFTPGGALLAFIAGVAHGKPEAVWVAHCQVEASLREAWGLLGEAMETMAAKSLLAVIVEAEAFLAVERPWLT